MSETKHQRVAKKQLGQFMTPAALVESIVQRVDFTPAVRVLEPSFGNGSFILPLIEAFMPLYDGPIQTRLDMILNNNIFGIEIDEVMYKACLERIQGRWGYIPQKHNLVRDDFFRHKFTSLVGFAKSWQFLPFLFGKPESFDVIIGNPPFGGTIDLSLQVDLDKEYGLRNGQKIKKETYSFFIVRCLEQLNSGGRLLFICSDTFMTIPTMRGLRNFLMEECTVHICRLNDFSEETKYPMLLLDLVKSGRSDILYIDSGQISRDAMELTGNFSWRITDETAKYFAGPKLGDYVICSSGMTVGKNEFFVRDIVNNNIIEPYNFEFFDDAIRLERELEKAQYHKLSPKIMAYVRQQELSGKTRRNVRVVANVEPAQIGLPHPDYCYYNKATSAIVYAKPAYAIYWKDKGDAVLTFKKNGNWYLHGVGGQPYFGRSGLSWQLISSRLNVRFLPEGYILDSGAPCAFLRPNVEEDELYFILGWACTELCTHLLKTVINHTKNIQSKDFERLPYPFWVRSENKKNAIRITRALVAEAMSGVVVERSHSSIYCLEKFYSYQTVEATFKQVVLQKQLALWP